MMFFTYTNPTYEKILKENIEIVSYNEALDNSKIVIGQKKKLMDIAAEISEEQKDRLERLLPSNIDNIRLIIEVNAIAKRYGIIPRGIEFGGDKVGSSASSGGSITRAQAVAAQTTGNLDILGQAKTTTINSAAGSSNSTGYGTVTLGFTGTAPYKTYLAFLKELEVSLRLVEIKSITFEAPASSADKDLYTFKVALNTFWLK